MECVASLHGSMLGQAWLMPSRPHPAPLRVWACRATAAAAAAQRMPAAHRAPAGQLHAQPAPLPLLPFRPMQDQKCITSDAAIFPFGERDNGPNVTADPTMRAWLYQARVGTPTWQHWRRRRKPRSRLPSGSPLISPLTSTLSPTPVPCRAAVLPPGLPSVHSLVVGRPLRLRLLGHAHALLRPVVRWLAAPPRPPLLARQRGRARAHPPPRPALHMVGCGSLFMPRRRCQRVYGVKHPLQYPRELVFTPHKLFARTSNLM